MTILVGALNNLYLTNKRYMSILVALSRSSSFAIDISFHISFRLLSKSWHCQNWLIPLPYVIHCSFTKVKLRCPLSLCTQASTQRPQDWGVGFLYVIKSLTCLRKLGCIVLLIDALLWWLISWWMIQQNLRKSKTKAKQTINDCGHGQCTFQGTQDWGNGFLRVIKSSTCLRKSGCIALFGIVGCTSRVIDLLADDSAKLVEKQNQSIVSTAFYSSICPWTLTASL